MKPEERIRCLETLECLVRVDPDDTATNPRSTFLPLTSTARALAPDVYVVLGGRGAGKTALFRMLTAPSSRDVLGEALGLSLAQTQWLPCFSSRGDDDPDVGVLEDLAEVADLDLRSLWACLLLRRVARGCGFPLPETLSWLAELSPHRVREWLPRARGALGEIITALDSVDRTLQGKRRTVYCCYDALDRISPFDQGMRRRHLRALLALWSSLAVRYRALIAKIFLREDLLDPAELEFPDASKLLSRAASLEWSHEDLSRLVVRYLARECDEMRAWLSKAKGLTLKHDPLLGWIPGPMPAPVRKAFTTRLVGVAIGTGIFRVETGRWITGRLQDAHRRITPRTVLRFFGRAGAEGLTRAREQPSRSSQLLEPDDLYHAIRFTSKLRVAELRDDYPVVNRVRNLAGLRMLPMPVDLCRERLAEPSPGELASLVGEDGAAILTELERLGVASIHRDGDATLVDIPDIYRFGFGIEADYAAAFSAYIERGATALHWLQRGDLPELDARLAAQLDQKAIDAVVNRARDLALSGEYPDALSMLENVMSFARHKSNLWLEFIAIASMGEITMAFEPRLSVEFLRRARGILDELSDARAAFFSRLLKTQECLAYVAVGDLPAARALLCELGQLDEQDSFFGLRAWIECQVAFRKQEPAQAMLMARKLVSWGHSRKSALDEWRGYAAAASAVLISGRASSRTIELEGLAPWALVLEGVEASKLRLAILLVLAPVMVLKDDHAEISAVRANSEILARRLAAELGGKLSIEALKSEAGELNASSLLDAAQNLVQNE